MFADFPPPTTFVWALFAVTALGAALRVRFDNREDHIVLTIAATVDGALFGLSSLLLVWGAVVVAVPMVAVWSVLPVNRARLGIAGARRSVVWMAISAFSISVGFLLGNLVYTGALGRSFPVTLTDLGEMLAAGTAVTVAWVGTMSVRVLSMRAVSGPLLIRRLDPLDSVLMPYLLPLMGGFPLIVAAVALYRPDDPWVALFILWWCFPLFAATALDVHRRRLAQELRRDLIAQQRLAAIGEVSARLVHQSRHQVGLMGWSIHRLRALIGATGPADLAAAGAELDALGEAKDRLAEMLTSELHVDAASGAATSDARTTRIAVPIVIEQVVAQLQEKAVPAGIVLQTELGSGVHGRVPEAARDVVFNLVDNAIDAANHEVVVAVEMTGDVVRIVVLDDGPGISLDDPRRAFEPFFTTKSDGTGMGLAIAEAVVGDLGGDLRYERREEHTVFVVQLPVDQNVDKE